MVSDKYQFTKEDKNKLGQILKELKQTSDIIKEKIYVNPNEAPKGAKLQRGPKGGTYYEGKGRQSVTSQKPKSPQISPRGQKVADWAEKKYGKDALYMLSETGEGREVYGENLTNEAINHLKQKYSAQPPTENPKPIMQPQRSKKSTELWDILREARQGYNHNSFKTQRAAGDWFRRKSKERGYSDKDIDEYLNSIKE